MYVSRVDPSVVSFSLSSHRHSYVSILFSSRSIDSTCMSHKPYHMLRDGSGSDEESDPLSGSDEDSEEESDEDSEEESDDEE